VIQFIFYNKCSDKWTKISVSVWICLGNNRGNFHLQRFTTSENIPKSFFGGEVLF